MPDRTILAIPDPISRAEQRFVRCGAQRVDRACALDPASPRSR